MKYLKIFLMSFAFSVTALGLSSCGSNTDATEKQGKEYTSEYICPMHCEGSGSEEAGKCPVCNMDYVENEDHKSDSHDHDGHNH